MKKEKINPVSLFLLVNFRGGRGCGGLTKVLQFCSAEASIVQVTKRHACQYVNVRWAQCHGQTCDISYFD